MMRRRRRGLGAITGERLEFRVDRDVFRKLTRSSNTAAFCAPSHELFTRDLGSITDFDLSDKIAVLRKQVRKEAETLRQRGVEGPIPVCVHPSSTEMSREQRVSTAIHERFHADVRRAEHRLGKNVTLYDPACLRKSRKLLRDELGDVGKKALVISESRRWGEPLEELLARTEEIRKACTGRSDKFCAATKDRLEGHIFYDHDLQVGGEILSQAEAAIRQKYGSAMGFVTKALRACKVTK